MYKKVQLKTAQSIDQGRQVLGHTGSVEPAEFLGVGGAGAGPRKAAGHRITKLPGSPWGGSIEILDYPSRAYRTGRGLGQKSEEHLLKLHTKEEPAKNQQGK